MNDVIRKTPTKTERYRSATLTLLTFAIANVFFSLMSLGALKATPEMRAAASGLRAVLLNYPLIGTAVFLAFAIFAVIIGRGLVMEAAWAASLGKGFAVVQMLLLLLVTQLGFFVIINAVLGFMTFTTLHLAAAFEGNES